MTKECPRTHRNRYNDRSRTNKGDIENVSYFLSKALEKHPLFYQIFWKIARANGKRGGGRKGANPVACGRRVALAPNAWKRGRGAPAGSIKPGRVGPSKLPTPTLPPNPGKRSPSKCPGLFIIRNFPENLME